MHQRPRSSAPTTPSFSSPRPIPSRAEDQRGQELWPSSPSSDGRMNTPRYAITDPANEANDYLQQQHRNTGPSREATGRLDQIIQVWGESHSSSSSCTGACSLTWLFFDPIELSHQSRVTNSPGPRRTCPFIFQGNPKNKPLGMLDLMSLHSCQY